MTINEAKKQVASQIASIEGRNVDKELRPWCPKASPDALRHWGLVQQRIALEKNDLSALCLEGLGIERRERSAAQVAAAAAAGRRMAEAKAGQTARLIPSPTPINQEQNRR